MEPIISFTSRLAPLPVENIDTDQIIPARFLKTIDKAGLGANLFADWRYDASGAPKPGFILNQSSVRGAAVLLAGDNFGCGSSREHAPWALMGYGFRAVISSSFGDIFRNNALKNGLLPIAVDAKTLARLFSAVADDPSVEVTINLPERMLRLADGESVTFPIDLFAQHCLVHGVDELGYLLQYEAEILAFERRTPSGISTL